MTAEALEKLHGTAIAYQGVGCLILGASGTGKSRLAADALMHGAKLIGDDQVQLMPMAGFVAVAPAPELAGVLEIRGFGLIRINDTLAKHVLHLVIELDPAAPRLPEAETREYLGMKLPYLRVPPVPHSSAAGLLLYIRAMQEGRILPPDWRPERV